MLLSQCVPVIHQGRLSKILCFVKYLLKFSKYSESKGLRNDSDICILSKHTVTPFPVILTYFEKVHLMHQFLYRKENLGVFNTKITNCHPRAMTSASLGVEANISIFLICQKRKLLK